MARRTEEEREFRRNLMRHLHRMHGGYTAEQGDNLSDEQLETLHDGFHLDGYACPPHSHVQENLEDITLTFGEDYLATMKAAARGE
jgi:16S rRNA U516 pseudouridylate synthase RsuA-like enzyme